ncbi:MAG: hypothetical protein PHX78_05740 [bacterium]|nr:hypothetical protein [bacterium]
MIKEFTYQTILGRPILLWLGLGTFSSVYFTASIAFLNKKGIHRIPFSLHPKMALFSLILAFFHALLALSLFLNF